MASYCPSNCPPDQWYPTRRPAQLNSGPPLEPNWAECYRQPPPPPVPCPYRGYTGGIGHFAELPEPVNRRYWTHGLEAPEGGQRCGLRYQEIRTYRGAVGAPPGVPFNDSQLAALWGPQTMTHPAVISHHPQTLSRLPGVFQYQQQLPLQQQSRSP